MHRCNEEYIKDNCHKEVEVDKIESLDRLLTSYWKNRRIDCVLDNICQLYFHQYQ